MRKTAEPSPPPLDGHCLHDECCSAGGAAVDGVAQSFSSFLPTSKPIPKGAVSLIAKVYTLFLLNKKPFLSDFATFELQRRYRNAGDVFAALRDNVSFCVTFLINPDGHKPDTNSK